LREVPADAGLPGYQLLLRAGFIRSLSTGILTYLPLGTKVKHNVEQVIRQELESVGGQEMALPLIQPAKMDERAGREENDLLRPVRFQDRSNREMKIITNQEGLISSLAGNLIRSYRQLPVLLYQLQTRFRDIPPMRGGWLYLREFTVADVYSLHENVEDMEAHYVQMRGVFERIAQRCDLPLIVAEADLEAVDAAREHRYVVPAPIGAETLLACDRCGYAATCEAARFRKPEPESETPLPLQEVATPACKTIAELASFLSVPQSKTAKAVFLMADRGKPGSQEPEEFVFAIVRGDMELNQERLARVLHARSLGPATEGEIRAVGAEPGYGSPIGLQNVTIVVDDLIPRSPNLVAGANKEGYHLLNVNYGRDFTADIVADIALASEGYACPHCGAPLRAVNGLEVGRSAQSGTDYTQGRGATFLGRDGRPQPIVMAHHQIESDRLMAVAAELHHDGQGLIWPVEIAPYQVHMISLGVSRSPEVGQAADQLYADLMAAGVSVLYDNRDERAGVKFNDADLIGVPIRLVISGRNLAQEQVELKQRGQAEAEAVPQTEIIQRLQALLGTIGRPEGRPLSNSGP
ncbi:MAG TPA: proline--tRNA ligase, partial [Anaerolineae bacterium]|nr:proline--tRNA ligase [Anaerolineae bacterium]